MLFRDLEKAMNVKLKYQLKCSARIVLALHPSKLNSPSVDSVALTDILQFLNFNQQLLDLEYSIGNDLLNYSRRTPNKSNEISKRAQSESLQEISDRMECLESISSCMDMDLIAKRLASSKVHKYLYISVFVVRLTCQ